MAFQRQAHFRWLHPVAVVGHLDQFQPTRRNPNRDGPGSGIQGIFLSYGLSLGIVGSGVGLVLGLLFVAYINEIAKLVGKITGHEVFDPKIYYFNSIPTLVDPLTVTWIVLGALAIAVLASVLPARRAARLPRG